MRLGLGLGLSRLGRVLGAGYAILGRVLDYGVLGAFTIDDLSGDSNTGYQYTGKFAASDAGADRLINANCSALGANTYYLTGNIRPTGTTATMTLDNGATTLNLTGLTADVWQSFTTATSASLTPSKVILGYDGTTASAADWSEVDLVGGATTPRWNLNDSDAADLDSLPALDASGGDYNGLHTGGAGGADEGIDAISRAATGSYNTARWFNEVDTEVGFGNGDPMGFAGASRIGLDGWVYVTGETPSNTSMGIFSTFLDLVQGFSVRLSAANTLEVLARAGALDGSRTHSVSIANGWHYVECYADFPGDTIGITIDGGTVSTASAAFVGGTYGYISSGVPTTIGTQGNADEWMLGAFRDVALLRNGTATHQYSGLEAGTWTDIIGSVDGTEAGSFTTLGQQRATILQMAGLNYNKYFRASSIDAGSWSTLDWEFSTGTITANDTTPNSFGGFVIPGGLTGSVVVITGDIAITSGSPTLSLRITPTGISAQSNAESITSSGSFSITLTATDTYAALTFSEADNPSVWSISNLRINLESDNLFIPEDASNLGNDVLGIAIDNRRTTKTINLSAGGSVKAPASTSLDTIKTVNEWLYYDGTDAVIIDLGTPTISTSSGSLTSSGFTAPTYHVNGVETATLGAVGWKSIMVTSTAALDCDDLDILKTQAHLICYNDIKLTETALNNFNAEKAQYGY